MLFTAFDPRGARVQHVLKKTTTIVVMVQKTQHFIFFDLWKTYNTVDREQLLKILESYSMGPNVLALLKFYWDNQRCVAKCGNYHGETFSVPKRGSTQGGVVFLTLFNKLVDAVVRKRLADVIDDMTTARIGLQGDSVGCMSSLFYANDSTIGLFDHEWLQNTNQHLCNLFRDCTGLKPNTEKTETMSYHPGVIRGRCSMKGYKHQHKGIKRKRKRTVCPVPFYRTSLVLRSIQPHLRMQYDMDASESIITKPVALAPCLYKLSFIHQSGHS